MTSFVALRRAFIVNRHADFPLRFQLTAVVMVPSRRPQLVPSPLLLVVVMVVVVQCGNAKPPTQLQNTGTYC